MAHFNFVISENAKWGHASFYIDCHRMMVPENILLEKKALMVLIYGTKLTTVEQSYYQHSRRKYGPFPACDCPHCIPLS